MNVVADIGKRNGLDFRIVEEEAVDDGTRLQNQSQSLILDLNTQFSCPAFWLKSGIWLQVEQIKRTVTAWS